MICFNRQSNCSARRAATKITSTIASLSPCDFQQQRNGVKHSQCPGLRKDDALIQRINPPGLHQPPGYHHVTVVDATTMVFLAGQCPLDQRGQLVGADDLQAQVEQVIRNIVTALSRGC